jgi:hypothetical protein
MNYLSLKPSNINGIPCPDAQLNIQAEFRRVNLNVCSLMRKIVKLFVLKYKFAMNDFNRKVSQ